MHINLFREKPPEDPGLAYLDPKHGGTRKSIQKSQPLGWSEGETRLLCSVRHRVCWKLINILGFHIMIDLGFSVRSMPQCQAQKCQLHLKILLNPSFVGENKISPFTKNQQKNSSIRLPWWLSGKESACQCRRCRFDSWVRKIPSRRKWQPTSVFLPGKFHGQRNLSGSCPWGRKESVRT